MRPYALKSGEGWTYRYGIDFTVKAGEMHPGRGAAFTEYTTRQGEEPPDHTHPTEDEMFYILSGELTFRCGGEAFDVGDGGFVYLPQGIEHGYTIRSEGLVRLLVVTFPTRAASGNGWGGFLADVEKQGELVAAPQRAVAFEETAHPLMEDIIMDIAESAEGRQLPGKHCSFRAASWKMMGGGNMLGVRTGRKNRAGGITLPPASFLSLRWCHFTKKAGRQTQNGLTSGYKAVAKPLFDQNKQQNQGDCQENQADFYDGTQRSALPQTLVGIRRPARIRALWLRGNYVLNRLRGNGWRKICFHSEKNLTLVQPHMTALLP